MKYTAASANTEYQCCPLMIILYSLSVSSNIDKKVSIYVHHSISDRYWPSITLQHRPVLLNIVKNLNLFIQRDTEVTIAGEY